ncbi:gp50 [Mycobacterium phage Predator]|uniref:Uncharacterized protein n=1 Tax=Mycobacterium phage Predator TaxID=543153 RepID=B3VM77_9CAUD|nr:gp50 [Mycobacterium phage Predator]ACF05147.1 hypothetical protein PREDATOR_50 [Mycobacterium phage Predator]
MTYTVQVTPEVLGQGHRIWISEPPNNNPEEPPINTQVYLKNDDPLLLAFGQLVMAIRDRGRIEGEIRSKDAEITAYSAQISEIRSEFRVYREQNEQQKSVEKVKAAAEQARAAADKARNK